jgi:glucose/arabinose dehydrogenase
VKLLIGFAAFAAALVLTSAGVEAAVSVRSGFANTVVLGGLSQPTAMAFAPDGRLFVCQQAGALRS